MRYEKKPPLPLRQLAEGIETVQVEGQLWRVEGNVVFFEEHLDIGSFVEYLLSDLGVRQNEIVAIVLEGAFGYPQYFADIFIIEPFVSQCQFLFGLGLVIFCFVRGILGADLPCKVVQVGKQL
jgi:hypothetical protein